MNTGRSSIFFVMVVGVLAAAPTVGDIGGCGSPAEPLDAQLFFETRDETTCRRCDDCGLSTRACIKACDTRAARPFVFPRGCDPLVQDAQVCLRAIDALSCSNFGEFVSDAPLVPTECDFCPVGGK